MLIAISSTIFWMDLQIIEEDFHSYFEFLYAVPLKPEVTFYRAEYLMLLCRRVPFVYDEIVSTC